MHIHNIALSFDDLSAVSTDIKIKQNDGMSHKLVISGLDFSAVDRAAIKFLRSDGVTVCDELTYDGNTGEYIICPAALAASGSVKAEISLYSENMRITSCSFVFEVIPDINTDFALTDTDTFPIFDSILNDMKNYVKKESGKGLSTNDYNDAAKAAVDGLGYSIDPTMNLPSYSSNSIWSVNKFKAEDAITGGLQVNTYLMLNSKNGLRDVVFDSTNLQEELDGKVDKATSFPPLWESGKAYLYGEYVSYFGDITLPTTGTAVKYKFGIFKCIVPITSYDDELAGMIGWDMPPGENMGNWEFVDYATGLVAATNSEINERYGFGAITPNNLDYAVRPVRPTVWGVGSTIQELSLSGNVNTIYTVNGIKDSLSITLPATAEYGDFIQVDFYSGETPITLTITSNSGITDIDLIPASNTTYSLFFDWGILYYDASASSNVEGWRFGYAEYPHEEV